MYIFKYRVNYQASKAKNNINVLNSLQSSNSFPSYKGDSGEAVSLQKAHSVPQLTVSTTPGFSRQGLFNLLQKMVYFFLFFLR